MLPNGRKINVSQLRHKFRKPVELYGDMGLIIIPEILPEIQKQLYAMILPSVSLLQIQKVPR